jgi:hypothetical protein
MCARAETPRIPPALLLATAVTLLSAPTATGTTYDRRPRPTAVLAVSGQFIAQDASDGVALYRLGDTSLVRRFRARAAVYKFAVTADEKVLLMACDDGSLAAREVATGRALWDLSRSRSGLSFVYDVCFARDGRSVIVCGANDRALIFETASGRRIGVVSFPSGQTSIMSAALCPDGSRGVLINLGEEVCAFDVATGRPRQTGVTGAWPIRYSADGRYVALRSNNSGEREQLRVVTAGDGWAVQDLGEFGNIGHIKPDEGGGFLAAALARDSQSSTGVRCWPAAGRLEEVWRLPTGDGERTDFTTGDSVGVATTSRLVTRVVDLRTGAVLGSADNSANYRPIVVTYTAKGIVPQLLEVFEPTGPTGLGRASAVLVVLGTVVALWLVLRRRRSRQRTPD